MSEAEEKPRRLLTFYFLQHVTQTLYNNYTAQYVCY